MSEFALSDIATVGVMISQASPRSRETEGQTLAALETALALGFFQAYQTVEVPFAAERRAIAQILRQQGLPLTCCYARVLNESGLSLSAADAALRERSVSTILSLLDDARELGADTVHVLSGPAPADEADRLDGLSRLAESMREICRAAAQPPALEVIVEPMDIRIHKKGCLGTTAEAVALVEQVRRDQPNVALVVDTAHMKLNGEDVVASLRSAKHCVVQLHFCNCVTEPAHSLYGDRHIPFGPPGWLDVQGIAAILAAGRDMEFLNPQARPGVFCEVYNHDAPVAEAIDYVRRTLRDAAEIVVSDKRKND